MDTQNCISSNVVDLASKRQICRLTETGAAPEQVSKTAHVQVLPFPKTAHGRDLNPQRIAALRGQALMEAVEKGLLEELAENERLRAERKGVWEKARSALEYWESSHCFLVALRAAQHRSVDDALDHPTVEIRTCVAAYEQWQRAALLLLLTAAPDLASIGWKRRAMSARRRFRWDEATEEAITIVIEADQVWLDEHPARQRTRRPRRGDQ